MKHRTNFISNSSSSSFIVVTDNPIQDLTIRVDIRNYSRVICSTIEEVEKYLDELIESKETWKERILSKCKEKISQGKKIYFGKICNENNDEETIVYNHWNSLDWENIQ